MGKILPTKKQKGETKMKKVISAIVTAFAVLTLCICLAACSKGVEGTYKFSSMVIEEGSASVEIKANEKYMGVTVDSDAYVLTIKGDNTWTMEINFGAAVKQNGTWEEKDGKYLLSVEGESEVIEATLSGGTITLEQDGMKLNLKK